MRPDQLESGRGRTRAYLRNGTCIRAQESLEGRFLGLGLVCSSHTPWEAGLRHLQARALWDRLEMHYLHSAERSPGQCDINSKTLPRELILLFTVTYLKTNNKASYF